MSAGVITTLYRARGDRLKLPSPLTSRNVFIHRVTDKRSVKTPLQGVDYDNMKSYL